MPCREPSPDPRAKAALAEIEQRLAALQHTKTEMADQKLRAETAAEIELLVRKMTAFAAEFDTAAANLFEVTAALFQ